MCHFGELSEFHGLFQEEYDVERGDISSVLSLRLLWFILIHFNSVKGLCSLSPVAYRESYTVIT